MTDAKKQIEEMAKIIARANGKIGFEDYFEPDAIDLYDAGYRKQSEGEWKVTVLENSPTVFRTGAPHCSICGKQARSRTAFCPNCGAKMKGGK